MNWNGDIPGWFEGLLWVATLGMFLWLAAAVVVR